MPEPSCTMRPMPSWPRIAHVGPNFPAARAKSVPQTPLAEMRTSTSEGPIDGIG
jgi:hypothetical protein